MKKYTFFMIAAFASLLGDLTAQTSIGIGDGPKSTIKNNEIVKGTTPTEFPPTRNTPPDEGANDPERKIFFVHGLGGSGGSWDKVAAATQDPQVPAVPGYGSRKAQCNKVSYQSSQNAISAAGSLLKTSFENLSTDQTTNQKLRNIVVAHSMGGLVSQYADYLYDLQGGSNRTFSGLMTFGTPNQGAVLADNAYPFTGSKAQQMANDACNRLAAGPSNTNNFLISMIINLLNKDVLVSEFCEKAVKESILNFMVGGFNNPIANDLKPSSQLISTLQGFTPEVTQRIALYSDMGNTDLIWRTLHYVQNSPNAEPTFGADNQQQTVVKMNENKQKYVDKYEHHKGKYEWWQNNVSWMCFLSPAACGGYVLAMNNHKKQRDDWKKGVDWWNEANDKWRVLCGDLAFLPNPNAATCECTAYNVITGQSSPTGPTANCLPSFSYPISTTCTQVIPQTWQDVESDGIVQASSASALPGAQKVLKVEGDSHFQLVNSPRIKSKLNDTWNGTNGTFFFTEPD